MPYYSRDFLGITGTQNPLIQEIELSDSQLFLTNGNYNLIPFRKANGNSLIPLGKFEIVKQYENDLQFATGIELYDGTQMIFAHFKKEESVRIFYDRLPEDTSSDNTINLNGRKQVKKIRHINTPTLTMFVINDELPNYVQKNTTNNIYTIAKYTRKIEGAQGSNETDYIGLRQVVKINSFYIFQNGTNEIAITDSMDPSIKIKPLNIIKLPIPEIEKVVQMEVSGNRLFIFTNNYKIEYIGQSNNITNLPITLDQSSIKKYAIANSDCTLLIRDTLFTVGSIDEDSYTLNVHLYGRQPTNVFTQSKNNILIRANRDDIKMSRFSIYDYTSIIITTGNFRQGIFYTPETGYSSAIFPVKGNFIDTKWRIENQFYLDGQKYSVDTDNDCIYNDKIDNNNNTSFGMQFIMSHKSSINIGMRLIRHSKVKFIGTLSTFYIDDYNTMSKSNIASDTTGNCSVISIEDSGRNAINVSLNNSKNTSLTSLIYFDIIIDSNIKIPVDTIETVKDIEKTDNTLIILNSDFSERVL